MQKRKERYFGIVKLSKGIKLCWLSRQDKNGWSLGIVMNERTVWLKGLRFVDVKEIKRVMKSTVVFIELKK